MSVIVSHNYIRSTFPLFSSTFKSYIHQGASIKNLEASSNGNGQVAAVKLGDGSIVEADTVIIYIFFNFH